MKDKKGKVYYGLHFTPGVAEYAGEGGVKANRIYINNNTAKEMDKTFAGCPVFVDHKDDITANDFSNADGYVVESFFNKSDGCHWAKFVVTSEAGEEAIKVNGWKLSNAYYQTGSRAGDVWHGVQYDAEVVSADYEHLAIVSNPRYKESVILTPEEFKAYNLENDNKLLKLANSSEKKINKKPKEKKGMLNFFKRERVENSDSLENTIVVLPKSEMEISIAQLVKNADEVELNKDKAKIANGESLVTVDGKQLTVNELKESYKNLMEDKKDNEEDEDKKENDEEDKKEDKKDNEEDEDKKENEEDEDKKENEDEDKEENEDDEEKHMENEDEDKKESKKNSFNHDKLLGADKVSNEQNQTIVLTSDKVALGKARYGSN